MPKDRRAFAASVTQMDDTVANLTAELKLSGMYEDSVIIFLSDNGAFQGAWPTNEAFLGGGSNDPLRGGKGEVYEGGTRTPAWVHSPISNKKGFVLVIYATSYPPLAIATGKNTTIVNSSSNNINNNNNNSSSNNINNNNNNSSSNSSSNNNISSSRSRSNNNNNSSSSNNQTTKKTTEAT